MADLNFDVAAGAAIDLALPDFPDAPASEATTGGKPPPTLAPCPRSRAAEEAVSRARSS
ncbi:MAG: hypothetical protein HYZ29_31105 [Myxococcales bacterium]|nr:hypothetical protein [Myxococcales bacterium]